MRMSSLPVLSAFVLAMNVASAADVVAYADESPPYQFMKDGKASGFATELLMAACGRAKLSCEVRIAPWARAYATVSTTPNTVLFSVVRRPDREREFVWLSPIMTESVWVFGRGNSPPIDAIADLKTRRIGVVNGGSAAKFLRDAGIPDAAMDKANSIELNLRKLGAHRIDYIVDTERGLDAEKARFNIEFDTVKLLKLHEITTYFAINARSSPKLVGALQQALRAVNASEVRGQIAHQYLQAPAAAPAEPRK
jgi:polar amino acid transport system substrate-binding protein